MKLTVLFLCTGNSCRSQMAEGLLRHLGGDRFEAYSAGMNPAAEIHPLAIRVMDEIGIDIRGQKPRDVTEYLGTLRIHLLVVVCDNAQQSCPRVWPGLDDGNRLYIPFDDPAHAEGTEEEKLAVFRRVRDELKQAIETRILAARDV